MGCEGIGRHVIWPRRIAKQQSAVWGLAARAWGLYACKMRHWLFPFVLALLVWGCSPKPDARDGAPRDARLEEILGQLRLAPDARAAAKLEDQVWARWRDSGSPTVNVLLERAAIAQAQKRPQLAQVFLNDAARLAPDCAEIWHQRAALAYDLGDKAQALRDIHEVLLREPRHFGALAALGRIYEEFGREQAALKAYQEALAVHPFFQPAEAGVKRLGGKADGREA